MRVKNPALPEATSPLRAGLRLPAPPLSRHLVFAGYSSEKLVRIVEHHAHRHRCELSEGARTALGRHFNAIPRDARFGNGRATRHVFQIMTERQARAY